MKKFDPQLAVRYALRHASKPNPAYPCYTEDCTNFISQCLLEGGWTMEDGNKYSYSSWFEHGANDVSRTWINAIYFGHYLYRSSRVTELWVTKGIDPKKAATLAPGDILQYSDDSSLNGMHHTCIVTYVCSRNYQYTTVHQHGLGPYRDLQYLEKNYANYWWIAWRPARLFPD